MYRLFIASISASFCKGVHCKWVFPGGSDSKESSCNAGDLGSIPGLGRSPGRELPTPVFLPRESPWTEESGGLQSMGSQRVGHK